MIVKVEGIPDKEMISRILQLKNVVSAERYGNDIDVMIKGDGDARVKFFNDIGLLNIGAYGVNEEDNLETAYLKLIKESR
jgi:hypothetical protein